MLYKEKYKVENIITEFLFNILNRGKPPTWFKQNRKLSQNSGGTPSHLCSYFTWNTVAVSQSSSLSCQSDNSLVPSLPAKSETLPWWWKYNYNYPVIEFEWWREGGGGGLCWPEGSVISLHLLPYHNNNDQGQRRELNFSCGRRLNIGQNNSNIFDIWNQIIQTTGTSTN